jgi:hypothetical protein
MSQLLEVVKVLAGDTSLIGKKFKSVRSLAKKMSTTDNIVVLEMGGTKEALNTKVGYRVVTKSETGEASYTRPMSELDV